MANPLEIILTDLERQELEKARDTHTKPYIRERSAAIVKIANGESGHQAALHGLYKPRSPDTIYDWVHRYQQEGLEGLFIHEGRGCKASFSPQYKTDIEAKKALLDILHQSPEEAGYKASRWTLLILREACSWLNLTTDSGLWHLLQRLQIVKKQGRIALHSPDVNYQAKMAYLEMCWQQAIADPEILADML